MNRRYLLLGASGLALGTGLVACANTPAAAPFAAFVDAVTTVDTTLQPFSALIGAIPDAGPIADLVIAWEPTVAGFVTSITATPTPTNAAGIASAISKEITTIGNELATLPGVPTNVTEILTDLKAVSAELGALASVTNVSVSREGAAALDRLKAFVAKAKAQRR